MTDCIEHSALWRRRHEGRSASRVEHGRDGGDLVRAKKPSAPEEPVVLTVSQAAKLLQVSENHLYSLISQDAIPHVRFGKLIRVPRWGLLQFLAAQSGAPLPLNALASAPIEIVHVHRQDHEEE